MCRIGPGVGVTLTRRPEQRSRTGTTGGGIGMTSTKHDHDPTTDGGRAPTATPESVRPHLEEIRAQLEADRQRTLNRIAADRKSTRLNSSHVAISYAVL